ncbi:MAG TPA: PQQ-dependent sugar dehydrogenase [Phycisphaerae bacterium]|nr:PQQ-dependent sugar dehydrogenase [Phycisphaerae bacterium]
MKPRHSSVCALVAIAWSVQPLVAQVANLRITEVNVTGNAAEVTNTGAAFNDIPTRFFCHRLIYTATIPSNTAWAAGQARTIGIAGLNSPPNPPNDSDLWLYLNANNFGIRANMIHGLKWGPMTNVGRMNVADDPPPLWPSTTVFCPAPPSGMTLSWDMFGFSPRDWYVDETPSMGSSDPPTTPSIDSLLVSPGGTDNFETMLLGDTIDAMNGYVFVNTSTTPGIYTVRCVSDVRGVNTPPPGLGSTQWLRIRDQDAGAVQNRFYTVPIGTGGDLDYSWIFYVNLEETPPTPAAANRPKLVVQHLDGTFQNAWGIEFASTGASLIVLPIGGTPASMALYPLSGATALGQWVKIDLSVDFTANTVSAAFNDGTPVSLPISLSPTGDKSQFRFCYRGEGADNINTMLLDHVTLDVALPPPPPLPDPVSPSDFLIRLDPVVDTGLSSPVALAEPPDASGRLFVVDQPGFIRIIDANGTLLPTPFLDLSALIPPPNAFFDERGVLGMAFHPDYATNGRFFVRYSRPRAGDPEESCNDPEGFVVGCHEELLSEFNILNADQADPASERILFRVDKPEFNHNSGTVEFGPDGLLYFTLGDGGGANDGLDNPELPHGPTGNGQNIEVPLGKMIRIDVDSPNDPGLEYAIPPTNPFVGVAGLDEIYAYGFRNPFKFSFDDGVGGNDRLIVADVGQNRFEEIDFVELGGNYGWVIKEGNQCFDPFNAQVPLPSCASTGAQGEPLLDPVASYDHNNGDGISIIGGFLYRGSLFPGLAGQYVFGDFSTDFNTPLPQLYFLDADGDASVIFEFQNGPTNEPYGFFLKGFGEDADGEIYVIGSTQLGPMGTGGLVFHLVPAKGDLTGDGHIDELDIPDFVAVLLGDQTAPHLIDRADIDDMGTADGADLPLFVDLVLP